MKKIFILTVVFSIIFSFNACKKDNSVIENSQPTIAKISATVENNMLVFNTHEAYENMLENWSNVPFESILDIEKEMGFHSMYAEYKQNNNLSNLPCDDPFLPLILSPDSKIKIGEYIFSMDFVNESVFVEESNQKAVKTFTFEDDVLEVIFNGAPNSKSCSQCTYVDDEYTQWTSEGDIFMEIEYNRYGIYYSLIYDWDGEGIEHFTNVLVKMYNISGEYSKCNSGNIITYTNAGMECNYNDYKIKIYGGSERLDQIHAYGTFKVTDGSIVRCNRAMAINCH